MILKLVIPCFNEENRLSVSEIEKLSQENIQIYLANDGSTDQTLVKIQEIASAYPNVFVLNYEKNLGKAATIFRAWHDIKNTQQDDNHINKGKFAYLDADFSTSAEEFLKLHKFLENKTEYDFIFGSRISTLNSTIKRKSRRHYFSRIFITILNFKYHLGIYDTQCGAKIFANSIAEIAFEDELKTKWLFDIEIFLRLRKAGVLDKGIEYPLEEWKDVAGSKLNFSESIKIFKDVFKLIKHY